MSRFLHRKVAVTLSKPVGQTYGSQIVEQLVIRDMRVRFKVTKTLADEPNTADVEIFNLPERDRAAFETKPLHVRLDAGYEDELGRLFVGDLEFGTSTREGASWVTKLTIGDGSAAYKGAKVNRSFKGGTPKREILAEIAGSMGLKMPTSIADAKEIASQVVSGTVARGASSKAMTKALAGTGMGWSIQDGELQILRKGEVRADLAHVIRQSSGLIGSPAFGPPKKPGEPPILTFKCKIYPTLTPAARVSLESERIRGLFKLIRVVHVGDTRGAEWYSECEAHPL